ncbi:TPR-like protein [Aspergillus affinis]|uniref:TPR-like protein n=1 Tax=Aspergillus affinis TaxID=1070780 RepID=UPI0022FF3631|nr:TPR-like protein [Aspergillus affinis]KAI9041774.1 TPR-like protein [Aspergillus affinis]
MTSTRKKPQLASTLPSSDNYYDLGTYERRVTTNSPEAQLWFNRGLVWAYSFNHEESVRCFEKAAVYDPTCAMAFWGIAYSAGPNYNKAWVRFDRNDLEHSVKRSKAALSHALSLADQASPVERDVIHALAARFPTADIPTNLKTLNYAYAEAMRPVYHAYPDDRDVIALFVDACMCRRPRDLWNVDTGEPSDSYTVEARTVLESGLTRRDGYDQPAFCHLYIHLMEMSPFPEIALPAADRLRHLVPEASHMLHMGSHIDIAVGDYRRVVSSNHDAMIADDKYFSREKGSILYTAYRAHNIYAKVYGAIMCGRFKDAISAARRLHDILTVEILSVKSPPMADWTEGILSILPHVLVRFGRWDEVLSLELPTDQELFCSTIAMILYARGIAHSVLGHIEQAERTQSEFEAARAKVPDSRLNSLPSKEVDVLRVASAMLHGELEYRKGNIDSAFSSLRKAVELEDAIPYCDPPAWMQPVRHALGALLLEQNRVEEAEQAFREDLGLSETYPRRRARVNNVWGLHGLYECLIRSGKSKEALLLRNQRDFALAAADTPITASCYCRLSTCADKETTCCSASAKSTL